MIQKLQDKVQFIRKVVKDGNYRYTIHGAKQRIARRLKRKEIADIITVYEPDLVEWEEDLKTRRKK